jgi:hypothetical protein
MTIEKLTAIVKQLAEEHNALEAKFADLEQRHANLAQWASASDTKIVELGDEVEKLHGK